MKSRELPYRFKTLVVDDHTRTVDMIQLLLEDRIEFTGVTDPERALDLIQTNSYDIVISDYDLKSEINGTQVIREARRRNPFITACLMSANDAAPVMKDMFQVFGGIFIEKPFSEESFTTALEHAKRNWQRNQSISNKGELIDPIFEGFVAETPSMMKLIGVAKSAAKMPALSLHMTGPTGTGKSKIAKIIHQLSGVKGSFQTVNCSGLQELAMSRLFGYKKGSFTGATQDHAGYIEKADGGTLFLDELHLLSKDVQGYLLNVLQDGTYQRLNDDVVRESRFRLITAASVDVKHLSDTKVFTPDLWYRISGKTLAVPALSERKACIPRLVYQELKRISSDTGQDYEIDSAAMDLIVSFSWEGNIRDLENSLRSLCSDSGVSGKITGEMVKEDLLKRAGSLASDSIGLSRGETLDGACKSFEVSMISKALRKNGNNISHAARTLGMARSTLRNRIDKLGVRI